MPKPQVDYDKFVLDFASAVKAGVLLVAKEHPDETFYGIAIYCEPFNGNFGLYLNSEERFQETLEGYRERWPDQYSKTDEIVDLRANCGDFTYHSFHPGSSNYLEVVDLALQDWHSLVYDISYNQGGLSDDDTLRLQECGCQVAALVEKSEELRRLKLSDDFAFQVCQHDEKTFAGYARYSWWKEHGTLEGFDPWKT